MVQCYTKKVQRVKAPSHPFPFHTFSRTSSSACLPGKGKAQQDRPCQAQGLVHEGQDETQTWLDIVPCLNCNRPMYARIHVSSNPQILCIKLLLLPKYGAYSACTPFVMAIICCKAMVCQVCFVARLMLPAH